MRSIEIFINEDKGNCLTACYWDEENPKEVAIDNGDSRYMNSLLSGIATFMTDGNQEEADKKISYEQLSLF